MGTDWDDEEPEFWEDDTLEEDDDPLQEWVMDCGDVNCCMNFGPHYRHECYTPEMYEAYIAEVESSSDPTSGQCITGTQT